MAEISKRLNKPHIIISLLLGFWLLSSYTPSILMSLDEFTWRPSSLWPAWHSNTVLYELRYRLKPLPKDATPKADYGLERVALIEFIKAPGRLTYRLMIDINESTSKLRVQRELILQAKNQAQFIDFDSKDSLINQGYTLSWRELTQEKHNFWSTVQSQFSYGKSEVYRRFGRYDDKQDSEKVVLHKNDTQTVLQQASNKKPLLWCRSSIKPKYIKSRDYNIEFNSIIIPKASHLTRCSEYFPLPDEVWPFLVSKLDDTHHDRHHTKLKQFELYDLINGSQRGLLQLNKVTSSPVNSSVQSWSKSNALGNIEYTLIGSNEVLYSYEEHAHQQSLWYMHQTTLQEILKDSSDTLVKSQSLRMMRSVKITGPSLVWKQQHWLTIDLNSSIPPLKSDRQEFSHNPETFPYKYHLLLKSQSSFKERANLNTSKHFIDIQERLQTFQQNRSDINQVQLYEVMQELVSYLQDKSIDQQKKHSKKSSTYLSVDSVIKGILSWMKSEMTYRVSRGTPALAEIIERRFGDCNELSLLFVEMMKAIGVQSEMVFGLVHVKADQWSYHAWARVKKDGHWYEVDPSRFEDNPHLAYIAFSHGTIDAQDQLAHLIGRVNGKILSWSN